MSKRALEKIEKETALIKAKVEKNKAELERINQWCAFGVNKIAGTGIAGVEVSEFLAPEFLTAVVLDKPLSFVAVGAALLAGKNTIEVIKELVKK